METSPTTVEARTLSEARKAEECLHSRDYTDYPCTLAAYAAMIEANPRLSEWGPGKLTL